MCEVTVIIPNYNHEQFLKQRIQSVLNQTYQNFEVIILDDCSTDNSKTIIESYINEPKIVEIVYNEKNSGGVYHQWQKGISLARQNLIWIAESDDYAEPNFLEEQIKKFEDVNLGISFCDSYWIDNQNNIGESLSIYNNDFYKVGLEEIATKLIYHNTIQNVSATIFRRDLALPHLNKLKDFRSCGDWFLYSMILKSSNLTYTNQKLNYFRWYHQNTSNTAQKNDLWLVEHILVLKNIDLANVGIRKSESFKLILSLFKKVFKSPKLSTYQKVNCVINLLRIIVNLL